MKAIRAENPQAIFETPYFYTYICGHPENDITNVFVNKLLQKHLVRPSLDRQVLIHCPRCAKRLPKEDRCGSIIAAMAVATSPGATADTLTILLALNSLWHEFRRDQNEAIVGLLQVVYDAMAESYVGNFGSYERIIRLIKRHHGALLALDATRTSRTPNVVQVLAATRACWQRYNVASLGF